MDGSKNRQSDNLGVNKLGKNIRKSPIHPPNFAADANNKQPPQPPVYNISKNDFRHIVQQLTGSTSQEPLPRPPQNPPKGPSTRLHKIRPPPLGSINWPNFPAQPPAPVPAPAPAPALAPPPVPYNDNFVRSGNFEQPSSAMMPSWTNVAESPTSAYMRYLQSSIIDPIQGQPPLQQPQASQSQSQSLGQGQNQPLPISSGPGIPLSPISQFLLSSPATFINLLSPKSPRLALSPGAFQLSPSLTPNFTLSPMAHPGIFGPGPIPPPSPGLVFPLSPSPLFSILSPRWGGQ